MNAEIRQDRTPDAIEAFNPKPFTTSSGFNRNMNDKNEHIMDETIHAVLNDIPIIFGFSYLLLVLV